MNDSRRPTDEHVTAILQSLKPALPAFVAELSGKPDRDWFGNELIRINVVIEDDAFDGMLERSDNRKIRAALWNAFQDAGIEELLVISFPSLTEQRELETEERRAAVPSRRRRAKPAAPVPPAK